MLDLHITLCLQAEGKLNQELGSKAAKEHVMILLYCCCNVLEEPGQCANEAGVIV